MSVEDEKVKEFGVALNELEGNVHWDKFKEMLEVNAAELKGEIVELDHLDSDFEKEVIFRKGMIDCITSLFIQIETYLQQHLEEEAQDDTGSIPITG